MQPVQASLAFSSVASLFGSAGQANYAAANAALEAWARGQAACGRVAAAVQWGAWSAGIQYSELFSVVNLLITEVSTCSAGNSGHPHTECPLVRCIAQRLILLEWRIGCTEATGGAESR